MESKSLPTMLTAITRGVCNRCPQCGEGKLLFAYLKPVAACSVCGEAFGDIRADDGPAWLTILIVGHIMLPIIFTQGVHSDWPQWVSMTVWPGIAAILMGVILPRAKGFFIGILWRNRQKPTP